MRFETSQHMRLSQQMKLAPRMIQSMEILQMPLTALQERIDQELESNIALEQVEPGGDDDGYSEEQRAERREDTAGERELVVGEDSGTGAEDFERLSSMERNYSEAFDNEYSSGRYSAYRSAGERDGKMDAMANVAAPGESLSENLLHQWRLSEIDPDLLDVGERIINYIDDDGLLHVDLDTILEQAANVPDVSINRQLLERALEQVQHQLDPPGIGARDRRECLLLQIERFQEVGDPSGEQVDPQVWNNVRRLITDHYDNLLQNRLPKIADETGLSMDEIQAAMRQMKKLTLNPGRQLVQEEVPPIIPDVIIEFDEDTGDLTARLSDELLPSLRVSSKYESMSRDRNVDKETREFVNDNVRRAHWLLDAVAQRKRTLLRVVEVVLIRQRDFFESGPQALKSLPMTDVADQLGIDVSTVSRAVAEKWMLTPRGLVPLRKMFSGGTETESGADMSWEAVRAVLKEIIDEEDKSKPLSDEAVAKKMKERGIDIARRTVVKYRQQLGIPPARRRKIYT